MVYMRANGKIRPHRREYIEDRGARRSPLGRGARLRGARAS